MSTAPSTPRKGRILANSFLMALFASGGYLIVALMSQHQALTIAIAMVSITVVLTPIFYWTNVRRARLAAAPRRDS